MSLRRLALAAVIAGIAVTAALTLGGSPERPAAVEPERPGSGADGLAAALRRCAVLDQTEVEAAGCPAAWEENRRRFFGGEARPIALAPTAQPAGELDAQPRQPAAQPEGAVR